MTTFKGTRIQSAAVAALLAAAGCHRGEKAVQDEAAVAGLDEGHFKHADENYFHDMDGAIPLDAKEVAGRNMWLVWSGGNDRFWNGMARPTFGGFDLLKIIAPDPKGPNRRAMRWETLGLVNEPCFAAPTAPDARFGLWLDTRSAACPPDPFADEAKYPGVKIGARGTELPDGKVLPVGSYYGYPSGIVGLRLFPNPDFDAVAAQRWDAKRYYGDPRYYTDPNLVRPYRVGMSCGFCHVGPSPSHPPKDPANPQYSELSSTVGAQYMWVDRLFFWNPDPKSFMYQWVKTFRPGAMDTSLVSTDNINNPRTMNAIYSLEDRLEVGKRLGHETLAGGGLDNKQFNDYVDKGPLTGFFTKPDKVGTPHVLKDGSDSVGALGALNRVYLNIGLFSEEWLRHFNPVAGGKPITPIQISVAEKNSPYWRATEAGTPATALFFLKAGRPDRLATIPGGAAYTAAPPATLALGRQVFADTCARCHSSKAPEPPADAQIADAIGPNYLARFTNWWRWTTTPRVQAGHAGNRRAPRLPRPQLSVQRDARAGDAAADQPLQPARLQRAAWQYLGQFLVRELQDAAQRRHGQLPGSVHRRLAALQYAGRRARLYEAAVAHLALVDRAVPAQQHGRAVRVRSVGGGADAVVRRVHPADAVAGETAA